MIRKGLAAGAAGAAAGLLNGLFGAAGGTVLIPTLELGCGLREDSLFPTSVAIMLPLSILSLYLGSQIAPLPWADALPYLAGSLLGGFAAGKWGQRIDPVILHRVFGGMLIWGGVRYLWMG